MQRAIVTIQKLRSKVESLERARTEPIAIIGMGCRFPGGADTPDMFFRLLEEGVDAITEVPPVRWRVDSEQPTDPEARAVHWGAFLQRVDLFDAQFFGISPREASKMDPQQRILLEVTFEALERAGQVQERLVGSRTGVFLGIMNNDYAELSTFADPAEEDTYTTTGNGHCFPAGRVSYTFGFQGPSVAIDTACSSSLVAVHLACQSLRNGECNLAVAGGVNLMLVPSTSRKYAKTQALSPDGRCKSFDATANGFVRGEGCGMIVLKRLSDAERDGDPIIAVIRGSAVNQDGRSTGLTAPNVLAQQAMLTQALASARVAATDIGYVETHGTGTPLGDPIEMEALKEVLGAPRPNSSPCVLGAVKTNVGHLEAAAGIAGIIKTALVLQRGMIPRNNHFRTLNPRIRIESTPFVFPEENRPWMTVMKRRIAGVSSFGMSGTNAHAILEEWPSSTEEDLSPEESAVLLPLSAKTPGALKGLISAYRDFLTNLPADVRLQDVVHSACVRRSHYEHRLSVVGRSREEIIESLDAYLRGELRPGVVRGKSTPARAKVVFVFSGHGSQWLGMGRELYQTDSSFRSVIDTCDTLMTPRLGWSILDELDATEATSRLTETHVAQPLLFALQIALVEMLRSWGISPDAMIGHGLGEIAAAHVAGILSLDEAVRLIALRGRVLQKAAGTGKMVAVGMSPEDARSILAGFEDRVAIAAIHGPKAVVISGQTAAVDEFIARCEKQGFAYRPLRMNQAFHNPGMDVFERELVERLTRVDTRRATLAMYSTVLGECVDGKELDVRYWGRNVRETVDFAGAVYAAIRDGYQLFLEIGPHGELVKHVEECLEAKKAEGFVTASLHEGRSDCRSVLEAAGALYTRGCAIEWSRLVPSGGRCIALPTYPWQRERFWLELNDKIASPAQSSLVVSGKADAQPKVVFVFPGQGSQWLGMGRQLLDKERAFRAAMEACDAVIRKEADFSVLNELRADAAASRLGEIDVIQPVLFAIEVALAALWRAKGVEPHYVVGHSMGEVAAAYVAGMLSLDDAAKVICRRSALLKRISGQGAMALVELPMSEAAAAIAGHQSKLGVAVCNGPRSTVLSGDPQALEHVLATLEKQGVFGRRVKVDVASHSPQVDPLRDELLGALREIHPMPGMLRMLSTVTTKQLHGSELIAEYWWYNLREPVRFSDVVQVLLQQGCGVFVEISPHPILLPSIEESIKASECRATTVASIRRQTNELRCIDEGLEIIEAQGYPTARVLAAKSSAVDFGSDSRFPHVFLGHRVHVSTRQETIFWQKELSIDDVPWQADHRVDGQLILPGSGFIEAALAAVRECIGAGTIVIEDMLLVAPLVFREHERLFIEVSLAKENNGTWGFTLASRKDGKKFRGENAQWVVHATARIHSGGPSTDSTISLADAQNRCVERVSLEEIAQKQRAMHIDIGPSFDALVGLWRAGSEAVMHLQLSDETVRGPAWIIHPALLDAAFRGAVVANAHGEAKKRHVLSSVRRIHFYEKPGQDAWCISRVNAASGDDGGVATSVTLLGHEGRVLLEVEGIQTRALPPLEDPLAHVLLTEQWHELELSTYKSPANAAAGRWIILCDEGGVGRALGDRLVALGGNVRCVYRRVHERDRRTDRQEIDPGNSDQVAAMVAETFRDEPNPRAVIYLWGLDAELSPNTSLESLDAALIRGCGGALHLVQALERLNSRNKPRLWLALRGTQMVPQATRDVLVEQAPLWGLGRTVAMEVSDLHCTRVDLDPRRPAQELDMLVHELVADHPEEEIALRDDRRFVSRLEKPKGRVSTERAVISGEATYLITGGLGGVGLFSAQCLVSEGARSLVLIGRHGFKTPAQLEAIQAMRDAGANIEIMLADVADFAQLADIFRRIDIGMPPLRGILHTAGVLDDGFLATQTLERFRRVFLPKVMGSWNLHRLTENRKLDFFLLYSSIAGLLGSPGLGNYVAANTFLDALAHHRNAHGLVATSINWGLFADLGMAVKAERLGGISRHGIRGFTQQEAAILLKHAMTEDLHQAGLVAIDFRQWLESYPQVATSTRFQDVLRQSKSPTGTDSRAPMREWFESLARATPRVRTTLVETLVRQHLAEILRMDAMRIDRLQPLRALGIDSLMGMELRNRLENALDIRLSATLVYAHPNVGAIAEHILKNLADKLRIAAPGNEKPNQAPTIALMTTSVASTEQATDAPQDDLLALFDQTMAHLESARDDE